jgi:hypothetical protein
VQADEAKTDGTPHERRAPFSARRWVILAAEDVDREVAGLRAAGHVVTDAEQDAMVERRAGAAFDTLPQDARAFYLEQAALELVQQHLDAEVAAGRAELLPDGRYRRCL